MSGCHEVSLCPVAFVIRIHCGRAAALRNPERADRHRRYTRLGALPFALTSLSNPQNFSVVFLAEQVLVFGYENLHQHECQRHECRKLNEESLGFVPIHLRL